MGPGGKGSNQAVATAKLGAHSYFAGIIGDDKLGEIATDLYAREGVDTTYLQKTKAMATGVGFIILNEAGENGIILDMAANKLMDPAFVDQVDAQIAASSVVMTVLELPVPAAARAMELGRRHGVRTILTRRRLRRLSDEVLACVDYLTPNETELRILMGLAPNDPTPTPGLARPSAPAFCRHPDCDPGRKGRAGDYGRAARPMCRLLPSTSWTPQAPAMPLMLAWLLRWPKGANC